MARLGQQRPCRIEVLRRPRAAARAEMGRADEAQKRAGGTVHHIDDQLRPVERQRQGAAHTRIGQRAARGVQKVDDRHWRQVFVAAGRAALKRLRGVEVQRIGHLHRARLQQRQPLCRIGFAAPDQSGIFRCSGEMPLDPRGPHFIRTGRDDPVGAGADGAVMLTRVMRRERRGRDDEALFQHIQQIGHRVRKPDDDGFCIWRGDFRPSQILPPDRGRAQRIALVLPRHADQRLPHRIGIAGRAVVKPHAGMQVEGPGPGIGRPIPAPRQMRHELLADAADQRVEDGVIDRQFVVAVGAVMRLVQDQPGLGDGDGLVHVRSLSGSSIR